MVWAVAIADRIASPSAPPSACSPDQQPGREPGLVLVDARVGRGRGADEDRAEAEGDDEEAGQDVAYVRAVHRDARQPVEAAGFDQRAGDDEQLVPNRPNSCDEMPATTMMPPVNGR